MVLLVRPPGDKFTFRLFFKLAATIKCLKNSLYLWSAKIDPKYEHGWWPEKDKWVLETELDYRKHLIDSINQDVVLIGVKDHLTSGEFNSRFQKIPVIADYLKSLFEYYPNKKFILFTSVENLEFYINADNVRIVPWGGDITNHQHEYQKLQPILEKNLDSNYTFLSLNRNKRAHRAMLVSLLYGLDIQNSGLISCMFKDSIDDLFEYTDWKVTNTSVYLKGFDVLRTSSTSINDSPKIYHNNNNDNVANFKNKLANYYKDTFVEIVCETSYTEACYNLTEKTLNSIYGCSFPILLCSKGSVEFLRSMGLDMFDDIIDHSYDNISDPAERLECAILNNKELLTNNKRTKDLWIKNQNRFKNNIDFCRERLYNFYNTRSNDLFKEILHDYNI